MARRRLQEGGHSKAEASLLRLQGEPYTTPESYLIPTHTLGVTPLWEPEAVQDLLHPRSSELLSQQEPKLYKERTLFERPPSR